MKSSTDVELFLFSQQASGYDLIMELYQVAVVANFA
jgi:hypothetical protein